jgi:hypothetical protein
VESSAKICYYLGMPASTKTRTKKRKSAKFILGRERFTKISAVEGIKPTAAMSSTLANFAGAEVAILQGFLT